MPRCGKLFHRAVLGISIGKVREDLFLDLSLEFTICALAHLDQIEVLDRIAVGVELEVAAQRGEVGLLQRRLRWSRPRLVHVCPLQLR